MSLKKNQKKISFTVKIIITLFIIGLLLGCLTGYLMKTSLYSPLIKIYNDIISRMKNLDIDKTDIFLLSIRRNIKYYLLLYIFSATNLWNIYYSSFMLYMGFSNGLLLSFNIILYGSSGCIRYLCYQFPQAAIFVPLYIIVILHCCHFHRQFTDCTDTAKKGKLLLQQFPFFICITIIISACCLIEAWLNLPLVLWYSTVS